MATLPSTLLQRLYQPDSLQNTEDGFELAIKNRLAPSTVIRLGPLEIGGIIYSSEQLTLHVARPPIHKHGRSPDPLVRAGDEVTPGKAVPFALNAVARVLVAGPHLAPGQYEIALTLGTSEVGDIIVRAVDWVAGNGRPGEENSKLSSES